MKLDNASIFDFVKVFITAVLWYRDQQPNSVSNALLYLCCCESLN